MLVTKNIFVTSILLKTKPTSLSDIEMECSEYLILWLFVLAGLCAKVIVPTLFCQTIVVTV